MPTDSTYQLRRKNPADVDAATAADQWRLYLDDLTGLLSAKDNFNNIIVVGGAQTIAFLQGPVITVADSPYLAMARETVKVDMESGAVTVQLPPAAGITGFQIKVVGVTDVDPPSNPVTILPDGVETINGNPTFQLTTTRESVLLESDGANWMVVG